MIYWVNIVYRLDFGILFFCLGMVKIVYDIVYIFDFYNVYYDNE